MTIRNTGVYMLIVWLLLLGLASWGSCKSGDIIVVTMGSCACIKVCQLIYTPIVGLAIYKTLNTANSNIDKVDELEKVANCMDD